MAVSAEMREGHKPSRLVAESNLHELEEQRLFLSGGTSGCCLGLSTSPSAPGSPGGRRTELVSRTCSAAGSEQG